MGVRYLPRLAFGAALLAVASCGGPGASSTDGPGNSAELNKLDPLATEAPATTVAPPDQVSASTSSTVAVVAVTTTAPIATTTMVPAGTGGPVVVAAIEVDDGRAGPVVTDLDPDVDDVTTWGEVGADSELPRDRALHTRDAMVTLAFPDGTTVDVWPNSTVAAVIANPDAERAFVSTQLYLSIGTVDADVHEPESTFEIVTVDGTVVVEGSRVIARCIGDAKRCFTKLTRGSASVDPTFRIRQTSCALPDLYGLCMVARFEAVSDRPYASPAVTGTFNRRNPFGQPLGTSASEWYLARPSGARVLEVGNGVQLALDAGGSGAAYTYDQDGIFTTRAIDVLSTAIAESGEPVELSRSHVTTGPNYLFPATGPDTYGPGEIVCRAVDVQHAFLEQDDDVVFVRVARRSDLASLLDSLDSEPLKARAQHEVVTEARTQNGCDAEMVIETRVRFDADVPPGEYFVFPGRSFVAWRDTGHVEGTFALIDRSPVRLAVVP